jgi:methyl-accepting chemotaxis protein
VVAEIASASHEQAVGIEQVNKAVMQMDGTTQQNAALVEQAAAASESIVGQAGHLAALVARWDVADVNARETLKPAGKPAAKPVMPPPAERRSAKRPWKQAAKPPAKAPAATPATTPASAPATAQTLPARRSTAAGSDGGWKEF